MPAKWQRLNNLLLTQRKGGITKSDHRNFLNYGRERATTRKERKQAEEHFKIQPFILVAKLRLKIPRYLVDDRDKDICWSFVQKTASIEAQVTKIGKFLGAGGICALLHHERSSRKFTQIEIFLFNFSEWMRKHYRRNFCQCSRKISCCGKW